MSVDDIQVLLVRALTFHCEAGYDISQRVQFPCDSERQAEVFGTSRKYILLHRVEAGGYLI